MSKEQHGQRSTRRPVAVDDLAPRRRASDAAPRSLAEYIPFCASCRRPFQVGETFYQHRSGPRCSQCMTG